MKNNSELKIDSSILNKCQKLLNEYKSKSKKVIDF